MQLTLEDIEKLTEIALKNGRADQLVPLLLDCLRQLDRYTLELRANIEELSTKLESLDPTFEYKKCN